MHSGDFLLISIMILFQYISSIILNADLRKVKRLETRTIKLISVYILV